MNHEEDKRLSINNKQPGVRLMLPLARLFADAAALVIFGTAGILALDFPSAAGLIPKFIALLGVGLATTNVTIDTRRFIAERSGKISDADEQLHASVGADIDTLGMADAPSIIRYLGWVFLYLLLILILGMLFGSALFILSFLILESRSSWRVALLSALIVLGLLFYATTELHIVGPESFLNIRAS